MRLLVAGSRDWPGHAEVWRQLDHARVALGDFTLVHGHCPTGVDKFADDWGVAHGVVVERHPADWSTHTDACPQWHHEQARCRAAGFRRNLQMVELGADLCLVFIHNGSKGSTHTANLATRAGITTWVFTTDGPPRLHSV